MLPMYSTLHSIIILHATLADRESTQGRDMRPYSRQSKAPESCICPNTYATSCFSSALSLFMQSSSALMASAPPYINNAIAYGPAPSIGASCHLHCAAINLLHYPNSTGQLQAGFDAKRKNTQSAVQGKADCSQMANRYNLFQR